MNKKILKFELSPKDVQIAKIINKDFLELEIYAVSDIYPNRNDSHFTLDSLNNSKNTFFNKPILGYFNDLKQDFEEHNGKTKKDGELEQMYWDCNGFNGERILGLIRESDKIEVVNTGENNWIKLTCAIWTQYCYKQVKKLLKSKYKKVSVEIEVVDYEYDKDEIMIIKKFTLQGITILGDKISEGIPGAHLNVLEAINGDKYSDKVKCLSFAYKNEENKNPQNKFKGQEGKLLDYCEKRDRICEEAYRSGLDKEYAIIDFDDTYAYFRNIEDGRIFRSEYSVLKCDHGEEEHGKDDAHDDDHDDDDHSHDDKGHGEDGRDDGNTDDDDDGEEDHDDDHDDHDDNHDDGDEDDRDDEGNDGYVYTYQFNWKNIEPVSIYESSYRENMEKKYNTIESKYSELMENHKEMCNNFKQLETKCTDSEAKCAELETKCSDAEAKCTELEEKCSDSENKCCELESKCTDAETKCSELEGKCSKLEDDVKFAKAEGISKIGFMMIENELELSENDKKDLTTKCTEYKYSSVEEIETDIATRLYKFKKNKTKQFKQSIETNRFSNDPESDLSIWEKWGYQSKID